MVTRSKIIEETNLDLTRHCCLKNREPGNEFLHSYCILMNPEIREVLVGDPYRDPDGGQARSFSLKVKMRGIEETVVFRVKHQLKMGGREEKVFVLSSDPPVVEQNNVLARVLAERFLAVLDKETGKRLEIWNELPN